MDDITLSKLILELLELCQGMPGICTLARHHVDMEDTRDILAVCATMTLQERLYHRLVAQCKKDKDKTQFDRAITNGWTTIERLNQTESVELLRDKV